MSANSSLPTLSQIRGWDTEHLNQAATYWRNAAEVWENSFDLIAREMQAPGGTPWFGEGAEAARSRTATDRVKVCGAAQDLRTAAATANAAVGDLAAAKKAVLLAVGEAESQGFVVGEDLSVTSRDTFVFPAEYYARQAQAQAFAAEIREGALALIALDVETAGRITVVSSGLATIAFSSAPSAPDGDRDPSIQLVDNRTFREGPMNPEPGIEPGTGGPGPAANAGAIREAIKNLPSGTKNETLEVRDVEQLRRFAEWATNGAQEFRSPNPYRGGEPMYRLPDGTIVGHGASVKHGLTMDIKMPDGSDYRIHVNNRTGGEIIMPRGVVPEPVRPLQPRVPESVIRPRLPLVGPPQLVNPGGSGDAPSVLPVVPPLIDTSGP